MVVTKISGPHENDRIEEEPSNKPKQDDQTSRGDPCTACALCTISNNIVPQKFYEVKALPNVPSNRSPIVHCGFLHFLRLTKPAT